MTKAARRPPLSAHKKCGRHQPLAPHAHQAAFNHMAVSKALLINGMLVPKVALAALFEAGLAGFSQGLTVSVARSQEPGS